MMYTCHCTGSPENVRKLSFDAQCVFACSHVLPLHLIAEIREMGAVNINDKD